MRYIKIMALSLMAAFSLSVVVAATASATSPGFLFTNNKRSFSSKGGEVRIVTEAEESETTGLEMKCETGSDSGEITNEQHTDKTENTLVVFRKCQLRFLLLIWNCQSAGQETGQIKTEQLEGYLGYIKTEPKEVGLVLKPRSPSEVFAEFTCTHLTESFKVKMGGEIIGKVTPINTSVGPGEVTTHFTISYLKNSTQYIQAPNELTVLGTLHKELLLSVKMAAGKFRFGAIATEDEVFPLARTVIEA